MNRGSKYYSQWGEDRMLESLFREIETGTCVEVGAHDGVEFSNTYYFEQLGWRCVLVEPNPQLCAKIRERRKAVVFECAASEHPGETILHVAEGVEFLSTIENGSSLDRIRQTTSAVSDVVVKTARLDKILEHARVSDIQFISIDVEGHELSVLRGLSIRRWRPRIILVESNTGFSETQVPSYMRANGYERFWYTGCNHWYGSQEDKELLTTSRLALVRLRQGLSRLRHRLTALRYQSARSLTIRCY